LRPYILDKHPNAEKMSEWIVELMLGDKLRLASLFGVTDKVLSQVNIVDNLQELK